MGAVAGLALGDEHGCALLVLGGVACWGDNEEGQLGDGGWESHNVPAYVAW